MKKAILITGINGFLGSNLARGLKNYYEIIGIEKSTDNLHRISEENFRIYSSKNDLNEIFKDNTIFAIVHAATLYNRNSGEIEKLIETNIILPVKLYDLALIFKVKLFINTDSFFNSPKSKYSFLPEYTLSKKHALNWLKLRHSSTCKLVNMKIYHMYGPNDAKNKFVPMMIESLRNNESFLDATLGEQTRDFIFIEDVVKAFKTVLDRFDDIPEKITEYEVGTGVETSVKNFILGIRKLTNSKTEIRFGVLPYRKNEIMKSKANKNELEKLGWNPIFSIDDGIAKILEANN